MRFFPANAAVALLICFASVACAQALRFRNYTTWDGLLSDEVYNLHQDRQGYIWIFTANGVQKFNGKKFVHVLRNLPFRESFIYCIYERPDGRKWVANSNGKLYEVRNDSAFALTGTEEFSRQLSSATSEIYQIYVDDSLNIYTVSKRFTHKHVSHGDRYVPHDMSLGYNRDSMSVIILNKDNVIIPVLLFKPKLDYFFTERLRLYINSQDTVLFGDHTLERLKYARQYWGKRYLSFTRQMAVLKDGGLMIRDLGSYVLNFAPSLSREIWVAAYTGGLLRLSENTDILSRHLQNKIVNDVLVDSHGGIWASTSGTGLFYCPDPDYRTFSPGTAPAEATRFVKKINDELYAGCGRKMIYRFMNDSLVALPHPRGFSEPLDITMIGGKVIANYRYGPVIKEGLPEDGVCRGLGVLTVGDSTIITPTRRGISIYKKNKPVRRFFVDNKFYGGCYWNRRVLLATENGVLEYNGDTVMVAGGMQFSRNATVLRMVSDPSGNLWLCTASDGAYRVTANGEFNQFNVASGWPSDMIYNISISGQSTLVCTNTGVYVSDAHNRWRNVYGGAVNHAEFYRGKIVIGTPDGLIIAPGSIAASEHSTLYLQASSVNGAPVVMDSTDLSIFSGNDLDLVFDVVSYRTPADVAYKLSGSRNDSGITADGRLRIQNLGPGTYSLFVYPENDEESGLAFRFTVYPRWFETNLFYGLTGTLIIIAGVGCGVLIFRIRKKRHERRTRIEKQMLEYKLVAVKAQINPHFVSNCLTAIQQLVHNGKLEAAGLYIANFGLLIRKILDYSDKSNIPIAQELELAELAINLELLRFERKFEYSIYVDPSIDTLAQQVPALIINPVIENAIWHGLLPLGNKRQGKLSIRCIPSGEQLVIIVEDNGAGFRFGKATVEPPYSRKARGLSICRQRLMNINRYYNIQSAGLLIEEIAGKEREIEGTRVIISLPLNIDVYEYEEDPGGYN